MRVSHLIEEDAAKQAKKGVYPDLKLRVLKSLPNQQFVGEILATGVAPMPNRYTETWEPEDMAFLLVAEPTNPTTIWRVVLRITLLTQVIEEWGDETDYWLGKWIRLGVEGQTANYIGQRALELFESDPRT